MIHEIIEKMMFLFGCIDLCVPFVYIFVILLVQKCIFVDIKVCKNISKMYFFKNFVFFSYGVFLLVPVVT